LRLFRTLRQQNELIVQLKGVTPGHRIPPQALLQEEKDSEEGILKSIKFFL
jgi:serine/threonine-protein phosphatase 2B catalytic subunit